jgi:hypothetical protein
VAEACLLLMKLPVAAPREGRPERIAAPLPAGWLADPERPVRLLLEMLDPLLVLELLCVLGLVVSERSPWTDEPLASPAVPPCCCC